MNDETQQKPRKRRRVRRHVIGVWMMLAMLFLAVLVGFAALSLTGKAVTAPAWARNYLEDKVNDNLPNGRITLSRLQLQVSEKGIPGLQLRDVGVYDDRGVAVARLNDVGARFSLTALLQGEIKAEVVRLSGAQVTVRRLTDGQFDLSFGGGATTSGTLPGVLDDIDALFLGGALSGVQTLQAGELTISLEDMRSGRIWQITDGAMKIGHTRKGLDISVDFDVFNGTEELAETELNIRTDKQTSAATVGTTFRNAAAADIALQSPVLSFLGVLNAPISGALRAGFGDDGSLASLAGTLQIQAGALQPTPETKPVSFSAAKAYFTYRPDEDKITFSEATVQSEAGSVHTSGHAYLRDYKDGWPSTLLGQFQIADLEANPGDLFEKPVVFSKGAIDLRMRLDPFSVDIGQLVLVEDDERIQTKGAVLAGPKGWELSGDITINTISNDRLLALWPAAVVGKTREWLARNIATATYSDLNAAIRLRPDQDPVLALGFRFKDSDIRYIRSQPQIRQAAGYGLLDGKVFTLALEKGQVAAPTGGKIDLAGSTFQVPDVSVKPADARVKLSGKSTATAVLSLLNSRPFRVLRNATIPEDVTQGRIGFQADIAFPMKPKLTFDDVRYRAVAKLVNVRSDKLVPGRVLAATALDLTVDNESIQISGPGRLGAVAGDFTWAQNLGKDRDGSSKVTGSVELSQAFVDEFNIALPAGSVSGAGRGKFEVALKREEPPSFSLQSDLRQIGLRIAALGWSKPAGSTGQLQIEGTLGARPTVDRLDLSASGLTASGGRVSLNPDGSLDTLAFGRVQVGGWLDAPVRLTGRGRDATPQVTVEGGTLDIRRTSFAGAASPSSGSDSAPIRLALDRVIISEGISLRGFQGDFSSRNGFAGDFVATLNGRTRLSGSLAPAKNGTAVRVRSNNAGGMLRNAGVFEGGSSGDFDLTLTPRREAGTYRGVLNIADTRVTGASVLAELLSAISVVGLLEQMSGSGIVFSQVKAEFILTPNQVLLSRSSAIGPSLGVSLDGIYDLRQSTLNMQGVISPVYFLNAIGQLLSPRPGEGLFGFNFRLTGSSADPRVQVNPLSILTPGMFRDIFRAPPPELEQ